MVGVVFGQSVTPVNAVNDDGTQSNEFDLNIGPLSINSNNATTDCDSSAAEQTCTSTLDDFTFSLEGIAIITANSLTAKANSNGAGSSDEGTDFSGLCILQSAAGPCTPITEAGEYSINIPGVAQGVITVMAEDFTTSEGGVAGSGLTVTMLRVNLTTPDGPITLDLVQAHSFVASTLSPPPAPTVAQLPQTGGPIAANDSSYGWYIALAGFVIFMGIAIATTFPRAKRKSDISDR